MRQQEIRDTLRGEPFRPFRVHLSNGQAYDVRHPELAALTRHSVFIVLPSSDDIETDRVIQCDLVHVVAMEPIDGTTK